MAPLEPANSGQVPDMMPESLFQVMWRHSWIIIGCAFVALASGFIYLSKATSIYTSSASIYVEQSGPRIIGDLEEGVMTGSKNYLYTQAKLITANPIVKEVIAKPGFDRLRTFYDVQNPQDFLKRTLEATVGKKDDILEISMDSPYPDDAALIVNEVIDAYITFHDRNKKETASEVLKLLQAEKADRVAELTACLEDMLAFKDENEGLSLQTTGGSNMILDRLDRTSSELTTAHLATLEAKSFYEAAKRMVSDPDGLRQFIEAQQINRYGPLNTEKIQLTAQLKALQMRLADRLRMLTPNHPSVEALDIEVMETQA
ncbi:MAG: hypothetical protein GY809_21300, partial [Planctomycetes bacterium]|nr:hypothetical protein [Planctomycetota bacterium]